MHSWYTLITLLKVPTLRTAPLSILTQNTESQNPMNCFYVENHSNLKKVSGVNGLNWIIGFCNSTCLIGLAIVVYSVYRSVQDSVALVGYEMVIASSYPAHARGIIAQKQHMQTEQKRVRFPYSPIHLLCMQQFHTISHKITDPKGVKTRMHNTYMGLYTNLVLKWR